MKPTITLLDDDPDFINLFETMVSNMSLSLLTFNSQSEFLDKISRRVPNLSFIDLALQTSSDGYSTIGKIRKEISKDLPIIAISSRSDPEAIAEALEIGADDYLFKPIDASVLTSKIEEFLVGASAYKDARKITNIGYLEGELNFNCKVIGFDELGIKFQCPHLIPKGTSLKLDIPFFRGNLGLDQRMLVVVTQNIVDPTTGEYEVYGEVQISNEDYAKSVRKWLKRKL